MMRRELTENERTFVRLIASRLAPEESEKLLSDLASARAEPQLEDGSLILFHIDGYERSTAIGQHTFPFEGRLADADGEPVSVLLFADPANRLLELEFIRWADGQLQGPNWASLQIVEKPSPVKK
ncbi:DUF6984 family protein [Paraburkholderia phenoliruptrix]|uniref:DUF6984 family protein n=1 Tax=Paraburkholderia phenoliruptrix TaxID=252970 RepID=UPI001C6DF8C1|nr:hypothetical protein [Paraburkholderia phenoliruptrix]MBW9108008.1 hypothetical protein [Paraburkholderia phenoliruptrix]